MAAHLMSPTSFSALNENLHIDPRIMARAQALRSASEGKLDTFHALLAAAKERSAEPAGKATLAALLVAATGAMQEANARAAAATQTYDDALAAIGYGSGCDPRPLYWQVTKRAEAMTRGEAI